MEKAENEPLESWKRTRRDVYQKVRSKIVFKKGVVNSVRYCKKLKGNGPDLLFQGPF